MKNKYTQPAFLICAILLFAAGVTKQAIIDAAGVYLKKEALPLKQPLDLMEDWDISPYNLIQASKIKNEDVVEQLGTEQYIQWVIEDTRVTEASPVKFCSFFVSYYTGNPDVVPHVPDECYVGGGNRFVSAETVKLELDLPQELVASTDLQENIGAHRTLFEQSDNWGATQQFSVMYLFKANGEYAAGRTGTRKIMSKNLFSKYSYYTKVEWKFFGNPNGNQMIFPDKQELVEASGKMLSVMLPILETEFWPDWEKANEQDKID